MTADPFQNARQESRRTQRHMGLDIGVVVGVSAANHMVAVREVTDTGERQTASPPTTAAVTTDQQGNVVLPSEGDLVVLARFRNRTPVVLGTFYAQKGEVPGGVQRRQTPQVSEDPSDPDDGTMWYRTDLDEYRGVEAGTVVSFNTTNV